MKTVAHLRIVLASPSDVQAERDEVQGVVDLINKTLRALKYAYYLELWRWETDVHPGLHLLGPQGQIDDALKIEDCDFLIGIFWAKIGTPVVGARSGTEHEVRKAIGAWKSKGSPQVMLYFSDTPSNPASPGEIDQLERLAAFKKELRAKENPLTTQYNGLPDLRDKLYSHLLMQVQTLAQPGSTRGNSPLNFEVAAQPLRIRSEGTTELLGDLFLKTTCSVDHKTHGPLWFGVTLFLNTSITSRLARKSSKSAPLSEIILQEVGRPGTGELYPGVVRSNSVTFGQIDLPGIQPGDSRIFRISNIRCNASAVGGVQAYVSVGGQPVSNGMPFVAIASRSLHFDIRYEGTTSPSEMATLQGSTLSTVGAVMLRFQEEFARAFKTRTATLTTVLWHEAEGAVLQSESNPSGSLIQVPGREEFAGVADHATRFRVQFMDLPAGIRLFVSVRNMMPVHATLEAVLVESASSLYPRDARVTIEGNEARETVIANGSTVVVWEMTALGHTPTTIEFLAYIVPFPENGRDRRTRCAVSGSFSPGPPDFAASAAAAASSTLPVPRFMPSAFAPKVFEINF